MKCVPGDTPEKSVLILLDQVANPHLQSARPARQRGKLGVVRAMKVAEYILIFNADESGELALGDFSLFEDFSESMARHPRRITKDFRERQPLKSERGVWRDSFRLCHGQVKVFLNGEPAERVRGIDGSVKRIERADSTGSTSRRRASCRTGRASDPPPKTVRPGSSSGCRPGPARGGRH